MYYLAKTRYPEFDGLKGCRYPGTPSPRQLAFTPRQSVPSAEKKKSFITPNRFEKDENIVAAVQIFVTPASPPYAHGEKL